MLWTHGVREGRITENLMVAVLSTNQAQGARHGGAQGRARARRRRRHRRLGPGPDDHRDAGQPARQRRLHAVRGHDVHGRARPSVYVRGKLAYRDGEVLAEPGSGRFVHRTFAQPAPGPAVR